MDPASLPSHHASIVGWTAVRLVLSLLLLVPIVIGMVHAGMRAWLRRRAARRASGPGSRHTRRRPVERPLAPWPERRVTVPRPCERRPWRSHRR
jgi:hypothetical protein